MILQQCQDRQTLRDGIKYVKVGFNNVRTKEIKLNSDFLSVEECTQLIVDITVALGITLANKLSREKDEY